MEEFLNKVTQHAMNYAIRSGIGITASFAINQTSRLLRTVNDQTDYNELHSLQERLDSKIKIISPAIDLIELISARGNTTLESAVTLTKALRWDIQSLGSRLEKAASTEEGSRKKKESKKSRSSHENEIRKIIHDIKTLIIRIEDAVPLINLAITTSGVNLSTTLPSSVSPSRLLQASTFLTAGDTQYFMNPGNPVQIGPTFTLSLYMLFAGHSYHLSLEEGTARETTWKEVIHKARVKLMRSPIDRSDSEISEQKDHDEPCLNSTKIPFNEDHSPFLVEDQQKSEFSYHLEIIEDLDDDRAHAQEDSEPQPGSYKGVDTAGIREIFPIYQIGKIFYADTGKILNIRDLGDENSPVLLIKRDINAQPPRKMMQENETSREWYEHSNLERSETEEEIETQEYINNQLFRESLVRPSDESHQKSTMNGLAWRLPADLDQEWLAFEVYSETEELDTDDEQELRQGLDISYQNSSPSGGNHTPISLSHEISSLQITPDASPSPSPEKQISPIKLNRSPVFLKSVAPSPFGLIRTSLSLLEMLIRLTSLQQFQQASHLSIPDELLSFFLEESSTTGAGSNEEERRRARREARRKVGFDPYDESPIKRRGEEYQKNLNGKKYFQGGTPTSLKENENRDKYLNRSRDQTSTPEPWLLGNRTSDSAAKNNTPSNLPSSPLSSYRSLKKSDVVSERLLKEKMRQFKESPMG